MLLTLLLDPDFSHFEPLFWAGWGLLLVVLGLLVWSARQLLRGRKQGMLGLAVAAVIALLGWQVMGFAVAMTAWILS